MINLKTCEFEMGSFSFPKAPLFVRKISPPDVSDYQDFSEILGQDEGWATTHGSSSVTFTWISPSSITVYQLKKMIDDALANDRKLYITIPVNNADYIGRKFESFEGIVHPIDPTEIANLYGEGILYNGLTVFINNLIPV